ncbi:MAG: hypothetical protein LBI62_06110 [Candidatus Accumulibacter sp.]|nr:hypothetical protein [Accumulibacter sp.]
MESGIRDQGSGIRDQGSGIRDQGSGIRTLREDVSQIGGRGVIPLPAIHRSSGAFFSTRFPANTASFPLPHGLPFRSLSSSGVEITMTVAYMHSLMRLPD